MSTVQSQEMLYRQRAQARSPEAAAAFEDSLNKMKSGLSAQLATNRQGLARLFAVKPEELNAGQMALD